MILASCALGSKPKDCWKVSDIVRHVPRRTENFEMERLPKAVADVVRDSPVCELWDWVSLKRNSVTALLP